MATADEIRAWAQDQGMKVSSKGRLPAVVIAAYEAATGDYPPDAEDMVPEVAAPGGPDAGQVFATGDKDPRSARSRQKPRAGDTGPTAQVRADIQGKTAFMLSMPAAAWASRDPYCGKVALEQVPAISGALATLFCQSPEIVEWFTGKGGNFMAWLDLAAALQPVVTTVLGHHVLHSIGEQEGGAGEAAPMDQYAA
jgi:Lsr2 protein